MIREYKGHKIRRSPGMVHVAQGVSRPLYEVIGRFSKSAGERPLLTSIKSAKEYISERLAPDNNACKARTQ